MVNQFDILYGSARGAVHKKNGKPNQDALNIQFNHEDGIFVVADGHGSDVCFRSDIGAKIAAKVAVESAMTLKRTAWQKLNEDAFLNEWSKTVVKTWATEVLKHLKAKPFTDSDVKQLKPEHTAILSNNALIAYGSTIVACMVAENHVYLMNLGDGDALIKADGNIQNVKLKDQHMVGGLTYSLSTTGCLSKFKKKHMDLNKVDALMLATDGYKNSFASEKDFYKVLSDIEMMHVDSGHLAVHSVFESWLKDTSDFGSGDDITAIVLLSKK